jgi:Zn-dependent protease
MIFNLLPIPPLDGFGVVTEILDLRRFSWYRTFYNSGFFILMILIFFGIVGMFLGPALNTILDFFVRIWSFVLL